MVFSSLEFLFLFLPLTLFCYFIVPNKGKNFILLIFSLIFYAWGEPIYILIMLFSTIFDYYNGLMIDQYRKINNVKKTKVILMLSIFVNLGILFFFKYSDFVIRNLNSLLELELNYLELSLPIGISFYTFQTLSYTIDVYKGVVPAQKDIIKFATYVTMFPQLVAGPIVQYKDVQEQLDQRSICIDTFAYGIERFIQGLAKKVILANNIGLLWTQISSSQLAFLSIANAWLGAIAFSFQIYFDFSGYSDMAIGLGHMFGFHFLENFNFPYISKSITEFWRRWHISLGNWFKEYVYFPLGGSRCSTSKMICNLLIVWFFTGLWHGANWNFVCWGLYFGIILIVEKCFFMKYLDRIPTIFSHCYTLILIYVSWIIFAFENMSECVLYLKSLFGMNGNMLFSNDFFYFIRHYGFIVLCCVLCLTGVLDKIKVNKYLKMIIFILLFLCSISFLVGDTYNPFLYFRF